MRRILWAPLAALGLAVILLAGCSSSNNSNNSAFVVSGDVVTSTGFDVSGIRVELRQGNTLVSQTITLLDGSYSFVGVNPGAYTVRVANTVNGLTTQSISAPFTITDSDVLAPTLVVPTPQDLDGLTQPTAGALLVLARTSAGVSVTATVTVQGVSGSVTDLSPIILSEVPTGFRTVTITAGAQTLVQENVPFNAGVITVISATFPGVSPGIFTISGTITDTQGNPATNVLVALLQSGNLIMQTNPDTDGSYAFFGVNPGTYTVVALLTVNNIPVRVESSPVVVTSSNVANVNLIVPTATDLTGVTQPTAGALLTFAQTPGGTPLSATVQVQGVLGQVTGTSPIVVPEVPVGTRTVSVLSNSTTITRTVGFMAGTVTVINTTFAG